MADTKDSALLAAAAEAVSWNHASQPDHPRKGQRVIIYPRELTQLEEFLSAGDPNVDPEDGHSLAYITILQESAKFELTPLFLNEDSEPVTSDPFLSERVPEWMAQTKQVATGCRRRTLENGPDVENSDDEEDPNMQPNKCEGAYTAEMDPKKGPKKLTQAEATRQRATGRALAGSKPPTAPTLAVSQLDPDMAVSSGSLFPLVPFSMDSVAPRSASPVEDWMNERERKVAEIAARKMAENPVIPRSATRTSEPEIQAPAKAEPLKIVKASAVSAADLPEGFKQEDTSESKTAASPGASADQSKGAKTPTRKRGQVKGQEGPGMKVPPPTATRSTMKRASGAGGLRGVVGSGQTEIGVLQIATPSNT
jgi:hypothetical protein